MKLQECIKKTKGHELLITWNIPMVLLSVLIAMIGSLTALTHAQRMRASSGHTALMWMLAGGITLGLAIWSMHFIGMLAFHLPIPIGYELSLTLLSTLPAIAAALLGFYVLRKPDIKIRRIVVSSLLMGAGISAMHYTGMAAITMSPPIHYNPLIVAASILIAICASLGALLMMYQSKQVKMAALPRFVLGGVIMGLAISGMHYTGMLGMQVLPGSICLSYASGIDQDISMIMVSSISLFWFSGGIIAALFDQRMTRQNAEALALLEQTHLELQMRTTDLLEHEELIRNITDAAHDAVILIDHTGLVTYWNPAAEHMFGYTKLEMVGKNLHDLVVPENNLAAYREGFPRFVQSGKGPFIGQTREVPAKRRNGEVFPAEVSLSAIKRHSQWSAVGIVRDATEHVRIMEQLNQLATTDVLTGICNRRHFNEMLTSEIKRSTRFSSPLTLILFDVDHFKRINDTFGHQSGDQTLIQLAQVVGGAIRVTDLLARWGGEEFAILAPGCNLDTGRLLAEKIRLLLEKQHFADVGQVTCSFGVADYAPGDDEDSLMKKADRCLYHAKASGRNRVETVTTSPT